MDNNFKIETQLDQFAYSVLNQLEQVAQKNPNVEKLLQQGGTALEDSFAQMLIQEYPVQFGNYTVQGVVSLINQYPSIQSMLTQDQTNLATLTNVTIPSLQNAINVTDPAKVTSALNQINTDFGATNVNNDFLTLSVYDNVARGLVTGINAQVAAGVPFASLPASSQNLYLAGSNYDSLWQTIQNSNLPPTPSQVQTLQGYLDNIGLTNIQQAYTDAANDPYFNFDIIGSAYTAAESNINAIPSYLPSGDGAVSDYVSYYNSTLAQDVTNYNTAQGQLVNDQQNLTIAQNTVGSLNQMISMLQANLAQFNVLSPLQLQLVQELPGVA